MKLRILAVLLLLSADAATQTTASRSQSSPRSWGGASMSPAENSAHCAALRMTPAW